MHRNGDERFDPSVAASAQARSALPADRLKFLQPAEIDLGRMERGIVFVFADWSGPCMMGFQKFTTVLKSMALRDLEIIVVNADSSNADFEKRLFGEFDGAMFHGAGEALWIRDGKVVAFERTHRAAESTIRDHTRALLEEA